MLRTFTASRAQGVLRRFSAALIGIGLAASLSASIAVIAPLASFAPRVAHAEVAFAPADAIQSFEGHFFNLLNEDRVNNGLAPLEYDPGLSSVARWRSDHMATRGYFSHDIGGYQVFQVIKDQGIAYRVAGENLAYNYHGADQTVPAAERALMQSPSHRENILRADYTHAGVGIAVTPDGKFLYTQLFKKSW